MAENENPYVGNDTWGPRVGDSVTDLMHPSYVPPAAPWNLDDLS